MVLRARTAPVRTSSVSCAQLRPFCERNHRIVLIDQCIQM